jgi:8-oxo-dGTP diphosphatase
VSAEVEAAGGVVVRDGRVALIHRPKYDDWTLPKGKADPGETDEDCARREVQEETSLLCELGDELAVSEYHDAAGRPKRVRYFAMTPPAGAEAKPQNEIDAVRWLTPERARAELSYRRDVDVVERATALARR